MDREAMAARLERAFENPTQKFCYYSANGAKTSSSRLNALALWDWTPFLSLGGGGSTCIVPWAFGCPRIPIDEGKEWVKPLITDPQQVYELVVPDPRQGCTGAQIAGMAERARRIAPGERIRNPDIQSPMGIAELMWDDSFYIALVEDPDAVHALLEKITDFQIRYILAIQEAVGECYNPCGFPLLYARGSGTMIADDTMSLTSPAMHAEFSLPYLNRIAEAAGPLYYHSCTWRAPYLENIRKIKGVRSFNWNPGNSDDPAMLIPAFSGQAVLALHLCRGMHETTDVLRLGHNFADEADFFNYCLDAMVDDTVMYWWFSDICQNGPVMEKIYDMLDERGYTPEATGDR